MSRLSLTTGYRPVLIATVSMVLFSAFVVIVGPRGAVSAAGPTAASPVLTKYESINGSPTTTDPVWTTRPHGAESGFAMPRESSAFFLQLEAPPTLEIYRSEQPNGEEKASQAAVEQLSVLRGLQQQVKNSINNLLPGTQVLYESHAALSGVAVSGAPDDLAKLQGIPGVKSVIPITAKSPSNVAAVPLIGAQQVWAAEGNLGDGVTVAVIDSGVDYTHADLGGPGTVAAYEQANAHDTSATDLIGPERKVVSGADLVGDDYNADESAGDAYQPEPRPDPNPLDCDGHGTHVAGTIAGIGVNADGSSYTGSYDSDTPIDGMRIGPGVAPLAKLHALRVFGCSGSTEIVGLALEKAIDPNGDGDPSDHVDVINMSLGSEFGSPEDADSVAVDRAVEFGITVVVSAGNSGDQFHVSGSPGNARHAISVAATEDGYAQLDGLQVDSPNTIAGHYVAQLSSEYDYASNPGLSGAPVSVPLSEENDDGCDALSDEDAAKVNGKVAFLSWTNIDSDRRCGSAARALNVRQAGAVGFLFASDANNFMVAIGGDDQTPGMIISEEAAAALRPHLDSGVAITISGDLKGSQVQRRNQDVDTIGSFTSRGIVEQGVVKPDIAAPGVLIISASSGTGNASLSQSGTSMAAPVTAGVAALVKAAHPDWSPGHIKADIMNTAHEDVYTGENHSGSRYGPNRVGAGRVDVHAAVTNQVLAYSKDDPGSVSVSFGHIEVSEPLAITKTVEVVNRGNEPVTYGIEYESLTNIPGVRLITSPAAISIDPGAREEFTISLRIDNPDRLTKTIDPTLARHQANQARQFVSDSSGRIILTPRDGEQPSLRVPVYAAPRPASDMSQTPTLTMPTDGSEEGRLALFGRGFDQGQGEERLTSVVSGFELLATSDPLPLCTADQREGCLDISEQARSDLSHVGATSDAPGRGEQAFTDGLAYFAITTHGPWRSPVGAQELAVFIDTTGDNKPDCVLVTSRLADSDVLVSELQDLDGNTLQDATGEDALEYLNAAAGDVDTNIFNTSSLILPVRLSALPHLTVDQSRIRFGVAAFDASRSAPVDSIALDAEQNLLNPLTFDLLRPGLRVGDPTEPDLLYVDAHDRFLTVTRDAEAYEQDRAQGLLLVHNHNQIQSQAQVVTLNPGT